MKDRSIKYGSRTFGEIRNDLISLIRETYPEIMNDFNDSTVGSMLIDINAGVGNNLSMNIDRTFQETQLEYAQQRSSILNISKNMGLNIPAKRPSVTIVDFTVTVPVLGDKPDSTYYPVLSTGAQVLGGGNVFEIQDDIDWNSPVSNLGDANRSIIPNLDSNNVIQSYNVTKREVVVNGNSNIYKRVITDDEVVPFYSLRLPDSNVIGIESVILLEGTSFSGNPDDSEFYNADNRFYEVDYLAQQKVFVEDVNSSNSSDNTNNLKMAKWLNITKKFIKEYTANGFCKLIFGSGDSDIDMFKDGFIKNGVTNRNFLENFLNNTALGERLKSGYTLFIKYRTGGGLKSNVGSNVLNRMGNFSLKVNGSNIRYNREVQRSLSVNNPIPAIGGNDGLDTEQIRNLTKYNFSSQQRDVILDDYVAQIYKMPGRFGSPYRAKAFKLDNKIVISILGMGSDGKLSNTSNTLLKENIAEYISGYRMINDYVEIRDGKIYNIGMDIEVYVENLSDNQLANSIINKVKSYFHINNREMNEDIFIGKLEKEILDINGVVNIVNVKIYNKVGDQYSTNVVPDRIINNGTGEILIINNTIHSSKDSMFEIKYPEKDIRVFLKRKVN